MECRGKASQASTKNRDMTAHGFSVERRAVVHGKESVELTGIEPGHGMFDGQNGRDNQAS